MTHDNKNDLSLQDQVPVPEDSLTIIARYYFAQQHLTTATRALATTETIEQAHTGQPTKNDDHRASVMTAILFAWAYLEAEINEFVDDAIANEGEPSRVLIEEQRNTIATIWRLPVDRWPPLERYQAVLLALSKPLFDPGAQPYQDVDLLRILRNALVHAHPETTSIGDIKKIERQLKSKFPSSRLAQGNTNPFFPDHCLSAGCARWAIDSVTHFITEFHRRCGC